MTTNPSGRRATSKSYRGKSRDLLVVGEESPRGQKFFDKAWDKVLRSCAEIAGAQDSLLPPETSVDRAGLRDHLRDDAWLDEHVNELPRLLPRPLLTPTYQREEFAEELEKELCRRDVWAVVSAAPSNATETLIKKLVPTGIPLLLAVDSTTLAYRQAALAPLGVHFAKFRPPLLQLVADNAQQASAMYAALQGMRTQGNGGRKVWLWDPAGDDPYISDLGEELLRRGDTDSPDLSIDRIERVASLSRRDIGETLAIVYVGYEVSVLDEALKDYTEIPFLIADGVSRDDSQISKDRSKRHARTAFFEPTTWFENCARRAYMACLQAMGDWQGRARSYPEAVRDALVRQGCRFTVEGANTAASFVPVGYREG
jgi:hypothetical protein